jgi:glutamate racemase
VDALVLGCTHYPLLTGVIGEVMGPAVTLVDSAEAAARAVVASWPARLLERSSGPRGEDRFCVTDAGGVFRAVAARFLGRELPALETVQLGLSPTPETR